LLDGVPPELGDAMNSFEAIMLVIFGSVGLGIVWKLITDWAFNQRKSTAYEEHLSALADEVVSRRSPR
jgi:hypothetical protein